ncbi:NAD(P)/FAD-dependent oxidoreductase [Aquabacterium humicola]|uniref:NAD(P)/FAD-dependent oxidoreductase n=1 Tax=Aquabacterium humicola TaxID=3237377 RepID=UPI002542B3B8|nr:NAD(P)/FAD-dependent oxidoreductase [Rubrivivax pictus]
MLDCLVIGAGPAGLTAAIYLKRLHRDIALIDAGASRAMRIPRTYNYPGFPHGVSGERLLERMREQLGEADGELTADEVTLLARHDDGHFSAQCSRGGEIRARTVLLATGVVDGEPAVDGVDDLRQRGLLRQCPVCDAHEFRGRRMVVIGRGDHGARVARFLHRFSEHLRLMSGPGEGAADARLRVALQEAGVASEEATLQRIECAAGGGVRLHREGHEPVEADVVYAALGTRPRARLAQQLGATLDAMGNVVADAQCRSSVPGLWAAGDVVSALDQLAVAVGHGAIAATSMHNTLPS